MTCWTVWKVAVYLEVSENTVRNYEKRKLIPQSDRHMFSGYRMWGPAKIEKIKAIKAKLQGLKGLHIYKKP